MLKDTGDGMAISDEPPVHFYLPILCIQHNKTKETF